MAFPVGLAATRQEVMEESVRLPPDAVRLLPALTHLSTRPSGTKTISVETYF